MKSLECLAQSILQPGEWIVVDCPAGNHNIVVIQTYSGGAECSQRFFQAAANTIAHNGIADFARDCET